MDDKYLDMQAEMEAAMEPDPFKTIGSALPVQRQGLPKPQSAENLASGRAPEAHCLRRAEMMLSCYRKDETHNPETYVAAIAAVMGEYDCETVDYVTDPRTGLPSMQKFLPSVAEVREALEIRAERIYRQASYEQRKEKQLLDREEWQREREAAKLTYAQLKEKYGNPQGQWVHSQDSGFTLGEPSKRRVYSEAEKAQFLEDARAVAAEINSGSVQLSDAAKKVLKDQDELRKYVNM